MLPSPDLSQQSETVVSNRRCEVLRRRQFSVNRQLLDQSSCSRRHDYSEQKYLPGCSRHRYPTCQKYARLRF